MKNQFLLLLVALGIIKGFSQGVNIVLTFQAKDSLTQNFLALDSVNIKNLTENCDTTLYDSVSVLNLFASWPVGNEELSSSSSESFFVMQNVPNPFQGSTLVKIYLKNNSALHLVLYDNQRKKLSEYHSRFAKGWQLFSVSAKDPQLLFLEVSDNVTTKTIKIMSAGPGNEPTRISYQGHSCNSLKILNLIGHSNEFIFFLGNQLRYTAYVQGYPKSILLDNPVTSETYIFDMHPFVCGDFFTIYHDTSGGVAPVDKIVTYGTVTNIPGETSKCWITSNLGADHQADSVNDTTEASAGWYWQFNRKQGYKHDGTNRTPDSFWIMYIAEDSEWTVANDPCALEIGNNWRIPTYTEWNNVNTFGGWANWNGPWNSALKMNAAGHLNDLDGSLISRGYYGLYWSSTQNNPTWGYLLGFTSGISGVFYSSKAYGCTLRCIKE